MTHLDNFNAEVASIKSALLDEMKSGAGNQLFIAICYQVIRELAMAGGYIEGAAQYVTL